MATRAGHLIGIQSEDVVAAALKQMRGECNSPVIGHKKNDCEEHDVVVDLGHRRLAMEIKTGWQEAVDHLRQFPHSTVIIVPHRSVLLTGRKRRKHIRSTKRRISDAINGYRMVRPLDV